MVSITALSASRVTAARDAADSLRAERALAAAVVALAARERDIRFFSSRDFRFWCSLLRIEPSTARDKLLRAVSRDRRVKTPRKALDVAPRSTNGTRRIP